MACRSNLSTHVNLKQSKCQEAIQVRIRPQLVLPLSDPSNGIVSAVARRDGIAMLMRLSFAAGAQ